MNSSFVKYNTNYVIYNNGALFSLKSNKFLKPNIDKDGYYLYHLNKKGQRKAFKAHRLVAEHFISLSPSVDHVVNHKDGNKQNNWVYNLEWVTRKQNGEHAAKNNLTAKELDFKRTKLSDKQCYHIIDLYYNQNRTYKCIAMQYSVSYQLIALICKGKTRKRIYESFFSLNK